MLKLQGHILATLITFGGAASLLVLVVSLLAIIFSKKEIKMADVIDLDEYRKSKKIVKKYRKAA